MPATSAVRPPNSQTALAALIGVAIVVLGLVPACSRPRPDYGDRPPAIVPSPFPRDYAWALMTFDGALTGEDSVVEPQYSADRIAGRYGESGILVDFGHGASHMRIEMRPLSGTGRYIVDRERGLFRLTLPQGTWSTSDGGVCSFNFTKVAAPQDRLEPPPGGEIFDIDIGFVCAALSSTSGARDLTITDGRLHAFLVRPPG